MEPKAIHLNELLSIENSLYNSELKKLSAAKYGRCVNIENRILKDLYYVYNCMKTSLGKSFLIGHELPNWT